MSDKNRSIFIMPHSHIDVEWYWEESTTRIWSHDILQKALSLLEKDERFRFTQDQTILLQWFWDDLGINGRETLKKMIQEKRLALVGGMYVMPDVSIPNGECLIRQIIFGQNWLKTTFGIKSECGWFIDTFGQIPQIPQILKRSGYKYNVFWRDIPAEIDFDKMPADFYWCSPDDSKILTHWLPGGYGYRPEQVKMAMDHSHLNQVLIPFGDDTTRPTMNTTEMVKDVQRELKDFAIPTNKLQCATILDYFKAIKHEKNDFQELNLDFNPPFLAYDLRGTYDNRIEIKKSNRKTELILINAETLASIALAHGLRYPKKKLDELWKKLLYTQFHDTLGGSDSDLVHVHAMERLTNVYEGSQELITTTLCKLFSATGNEKSTGIIVFNPLSFSRTEVACHSLDLNRNESVTIRDDNGQSVALRIVREDSENYIEFLAENIPPLGFRRFEINRENTPTEIKIPPTCNDNLIENSHFQVKWDPNTGDLIKIWDKENQRSVLSSPGNVIVSMGENNPDMEGAIRLNGKIATSSQFTLTDIKVTEDELGKTCILTSDYSNCIIQRKIVIQGFSRRIDFQISILDYSGGDEIIKVSFPLNIDWKNVVRTYETPFAATERPDGHFAAQNWVDCSDSTYGMTLFNTGTPGYWIGEGSLDLVLLRSFTNYTDYRVNGLKKGIPGYELSAQTELANEHGSHDYRYSLYPHKGSRNYDELSKIGQSLNNPFYTIKGNTNSTSFASNTSFISIEPDFLMTAFKLSENMKQLVFRGYETSGKSHLVYLCVPGWVKAVYKANLLEQPEESLPLVGAIVSFVCAPHEIVTMLLDHS